MYTKEFFDLQHAKSYLQGSIIRYRGNPVYVQHIASGANRGSYLITYHELNDVRDGINPKLGNFPDDAFNLNPVPLGMLNVGSGSVAYVERMPVRQWKIGLTSGNSTSHDVFTGDRMVDHRRDIYSVHMRDTILGKYPKLRTLLLQRTPQAAFSRRFAIRKKKIFYRTRGVVGYIRNGQPELDDKFFFLKEVLMEDLHG